MKKRYYILLFFPIFLFSQNFNWVNFPTISYSLNPNSIGYTTTCDTAGNSYCIGFKDTAYINSEVYGNTFYNKYSSTGELLFSKTFTGRISIKNAVVDADNNVYLAVAMISMVTIGTNNLTTNGSGSNPIIIKLNSDGEFMYYINLKSTLGSANHMDAITTDNQNNIYVGYDDFSNSYITKFSSLGALQFTITQQNVQIISSLSVDNLGNIYASGSCGSTNSRFAGVLEPTSLPYSSYAVKYLPSGIHQWTKYIEDISCLDPKISAKNPNNIYLSSSLSDSFTFGNLTSQGPLTGFSDDIYITKLNANGDFQWIREVLGSGKAYTGNRNFLESDLNGNVYFAGSTKGTTNWTTAQSTVISGFNSDILLLKYNSNGDLLFTKTAGGSGDDRADGVALDIEGNIILTGMVDNGTILFDNLSNTVPDNSPFITKINTTLKVTSFEKTKIKIYPNPAQNQIFISGLFQKTKATIYTALGQKIKDLELENEEPIAINDLALGIYFLKTESNSIVKFIKN